MNEFCIASRRQAEGALFAVVGRAGEGVPDGVADAGRVEAEVGEKLAALAVLDEAVG